MLNGERITARIIALGALLVLLQACGGGGGGGGGGSSMMMCLAGQVRDSGDDMCRAPETDAECMELNTMTPVLVGGACRAECGEGETRNMTTHACETSMPMPMPVTCTAPTPFSHNGACRATCPPEALIPNNGVCEPATSAAECMDADSTLMFLHSGTCVAECPDEALIPNNGVCEPATSAAECMGADSTLMFLDSGTCVAECPNTASVSHNGVCMEMCPDEALIPNNGVCEPATSAAECMGADPTLMFLHSGTCVAECPNTASVSHNSVCMEMCPTAAPMPGTNNVCRARVASDCTDDTRPVLDSDGTTCRGRGTDDGMGTVALSLVGATGTEGTDVVFAEMIGQDDTAAYNEISAAAVNELDRLARTQSGNCGSGCTAKDITTITASRPGGNTRIDAFNIFKDGPSGTRFTLDIESTVTQPNAPTRANNAADRRLRDSDTAGGGLDGWNYRQHELSDSAMTATADIIEWNNDRNYYMAGGVFAYELNQTPPTRGASTIFDLDQQGDVRIGDVFPTTGEATYTGHSFGYYTTLPAPAGKTDNRGYFAARARLTADFANERVSGTIDNFLLSEDKMFSVNGKSPLEDALSGLSVELGANNTGGITTKVGSATVATFRGDTSATGVMVDGEMLTLEGEYGGLFYEAQGQVGSADAPLAVGGTWGAAGATTNPAPTIGTDGGFGISFIGAFGAKRCRGDTPILGDDGVCRRAENNAECADRNPALPIADNGACRAVEAPAETMFTGTGDTNHAQYLAVADHLPLFDDGTATASSVTLGSVGADDDSDADTPDRTTDRVRLLVGGDLSQPDKKEVDSVRIDVGNTGGTGLQSTTAPVAPATTALAADRRRDTEPGGFSAGTTTEDPVWEYSTVIVARNVGDQVINVDPPGTAGELRAFVVEWSSDADNYLGGGVWARATGTGATDVQFGAFVDGTNPTDADDTDGDADDLNDATGMATYRGHAYGRYSLNNGIAEDPDDPNDENDANPGFFAAKAVLNADFGDASEDGTISGRIHNFLFSQDNTFTDGMTSELEDAIGGAERFAVTLQEATIDNNTFNAAAAGSRIQLLGASGELLDPVGQWGGRFYGTPERTGDAPELVGGVFAVADDNTTDDPAGSVSFSIIGSFGAKRPTQ